MSSITNNQAASRYELVTDGHLSVAEYRRDGSKCIITHVEVPPELRGRGVAAQLMQGVVEDARQHGLTLVPVCSYAVAYLQRHKE
jgi:uncharacterized protein